MRGRLRRAAVLAAAVAVTAPLLAFPIGRSSAQEGTPATVETVVVAMEHGEDPAAVALALGAEPVAVAPGAESAALAAPPDTIRGLAADHRVAAVLERGRAVVQPSLANSVPKVGAPALWGEGHRGAGKVIAVIDTGVDAGFGGEIVGQACFAATETSGVVDGHCGSSSNAEASFSSLCFDLGVCGAGDLVQADAGAPCSTSQACSHGSAVAAVAARHEPNPGVAPDAGVYAIRVFNPSGSSADLVDVYLALVHVLELEEAGLDVAAVNMSVATSELYASTCDSASVQGGAGAAFADVILALRDRGVATAIASGNSGSSTRLAFPACVSTGISVGATDLDDDLAIFSNRGPGLDLLAPGAAEAAAPPASGLTIPSGTGFSSWAGTSFSAPHVAGALALMAQTYPQADASQLTSLLVSTGVPVGGRRRLQLKSPATALVAGRLFPSTTPVGGSPRVATGDLDADGRADVLVHGPGSGADSVAYGTAGYRLDTRTMTVSGSFTPLVGGFSGTATGPDDIVWYAPGDGADGLWAGRTDRTFGKSNLAIDGTFSPIVGDFDADGWDDIFWYGPGTAPDVISYGGSGGLTTISTSISGTYRTVDGDFAAGGHDDLQFHSPGYAADGLWLGGPGRAFTKRSLVISGDYTLVALDENGDGADDVVLYQPGAAADYLLLGGAGVGGSGALAGFGSVVVSVGGAYRPATGDFDHDGHDDLLWHAPGPAADWIWFGRAAGPPSSRGVTVNGSYRPVGADVDGLAGDEVVFYDPAAQTSPVWWSYEAPP